MRTWLLVILTGALAACGGKVVLDSSSSGAGGGGASSTGCPACSGTAGVGGASGTSGVGAASGTGGAGGSCGALLDALESALTAATSCTDNAMSNPCQTTVQDVCGCEILADDMGNVAAAATAAYAALVAAHCEPECPSPCIPVSTMFAACENGMCVEGPG